MVFIVKLAKIQLERFNALPEKLWAPFLPIPTCV